MKGIIKKFLISLTLVVTILAGGFLSQPVKAAVGDTIAETFPDQNMAQGVANTISSGDVNAVLTQVMADGLTTLTINGQGIQNATGIDVFSNLEYLNLGYNELENLPDSIGNLSNLQYLNLAYNQLSSLPTSIGNLINLKNIELSNNQFLTSLPESIGNLSALEYFTSSETSLESLPESIGNLNNLHHLILFYNNITTLPESIGNLSNLEYLNIQGNSLTSLPESIGRLNSLWHLDLHENKLTSLPSSITDLSNLEYLSLYNNHLTVIPGNIGNLSKLREFDLSSNQLQTLPESIGSLTNLFSLGLRYNQLTEIPDSIGNLSGLWYLLIDNNQLTSLPENISKLTNLQTFYLENNLLPVGYNNILNTLGLNMTFDYEEQRQLIVKAGLSPYTIKSESDLNNINLFDAVQIYISTDVSLSHNLIFENYVDENGNQVSLSDFIKNGIVQKSGKVYVQVRATGVGLFPNNSEHAVTVDYIELNFETIEYLLSFNLNGGTGTAPENQSLIEGTKGTAVANPSRKGYSFKGWNTVADGSGTSWIPGITPMIGSDVTLYAQWKENTKPVPPKPEDNKTDQASEGILPQTGGYEALLISFLTLGTCLLASARCFRKKQKNL